jgi:hypothetical protein
MQFLFFFALSFSVCFGAGASPHPSAAEADRYGSIKSTAKSVVDLALLSSVVSALVKLYELPSTTRFWSTSFALQWSSVALILADTICMLVLVSKEPADQVVFFFFFFFFCELAVLIINELLMVIYFSRSSDPHFRNAWCRTAAPESSRFLSGQTFGTGNVPKKRFK